MLVYGFPTDPTFPVDPKLLFSSDSAQTLQIIHSLLKVILQSITTTPPHPPKKKKIGEKNFLANLLYFFHHETLNQSFFLLFNFFLFFFALGLCLNFPLSVIKGRHAQIPTV